MWWRQSERMDVAPRQCFKPGTFLPSFISISDCKGGVKLVKLCHKSSNQQPMESLLEANRKRKQSHIFEGHYIFITDDSQCRPCGMPSLPATSRLLHSCGKVLDGGGRIFFIAHPGQNDDLYCSYELSVGYNIAFALHCPDLVTPKGN